MTKCFFTIALLFCSAASPSSSSSNSARFDLVCHVHLLGGGDEGWVVRERIDLTTMQYCGGAGSTECDEIHPIKAVNDTEIVFTSSYNDVWGSTMSKVNRRSGAYVSSGPLGTIYGTCKSTSFSGFPTRKF